MKSKAIFVETCILLGLTFLLGVLLVVRPHVKSSERQRAAEALLAALEAGATSVLVDADALPVEGEEEEFSDLNELMAQDPYVRPLTGNAAALQLLGDIRIPKIDLAVPVLEGSYNLQLRYGAGHLAQSSGIGEPGTCVLLGHRMQNYGEIFNRFGELEAGDLLALHDTQRNSYAYKITSIQIVKPQALPELLYEPPEGDILALVTCDPIETAVNRMVVWCERVDTTVHRESGEEESST